MENNSHRAEMIQRITRAEKLLGSKLLTKQQEWLIFDTPSPSDFLRREGGSTILCLDVTIYSQDNPNTHQLLITNSYSDCKHLISKLENFQYDQIDDTFNIQSTKSTNNKSFPIIKFSNGSIIEFVAVGDFKNIKGDDFTKYSRILADLMEANTDSIYDMLVNTNRPFKIVSSLNECNQEHMEFLQNMTA